MTLLAIEQDSGSSSIGYFGVQKINIIGRPSQTTWQMPSQVSKGTTPIYALWSKSQILTTKKLQNPSPPITT
jgi:hypothetical protein